MFPSKNYLVLGLPFRSFIHFGINFSHMALDKGQTYYFAGGYPVFLGTIE